MTFNTSERIGASAPETAAASPPTDSLSSLPEVPIELIQSYLDRSNAGALRSTNRSLYNALDPCKAAIMRFESKNSITPLEIMLLVKELKRIKQDAAIMRFESKNSITPLEIMLLVKELKRIKQDYVLRIISLKPFKLDLSGDNNKISDEFLGNIIKVFPNITEINAPHCSRIITTPWLKCFEKLKNLTSLNLAGSKIFEGGLKNLRCNNLTNLDLVGCKIIDINGQDLAIDEELEFLPPTLKRLNLGDCQITDKGMKYLVNSAMNLRSLDLSWCRITGHGVQYLASLPHLKSLSLSIIDDDMKHLAGLTNLKSLVLRAVQLTDNGLQCLAAASPQLKSLDLVFCLSITDGGLKHLAGLENLESLDLPLCGKVTDKGLRDLMNGGNYRIQMKQHDRVCLISNLYNFLDSVQFHDFLAGAPVSHGSV